MPFTIHCLTPTSYSAVSRATWSRRLHPEEIVDQQLGALTFQHGWWCGRIGGTDVAIRLRAGRDGPDATIRQTAVDAVRELADLEVRGRDYLTHAAGERPWPGLKLAAVEILHPAAGWVRNHVTDREAADAMLNGTPVVSLEFEIAGDRNVADVVLFNGVPVGWDYH